jgi:hypothetical protein
LNDNPQIADELTVLMQNYIDNGRSTPGIKQVNDYAISLSSELGNGKTKKAKKRK